MPDNAGLLLIAMVFIVVPQIAMIWVKGQDEYSFRILGFTILAFLGVFSGLVVSNSDNATGVFGLLGVIAGYVIGKKGP